MKYFASLLESDLYRKRVSLDSSFEVSAAAAVVEELAPSGSAFAASDVAAAGSRCLPGPFRAENK